MGRIVKILLYLVVLFFVFFWLSTVFDSCKNPSGNVITDAVETIEETTEDIVDGADDLVDDLEDDFFDDDEDDIDYEELDAEEDFEDADIYEDEKVTPVQEEKPIIKSSPKPVRTTSGGGNYLVIAGSYLLKSNANDMRAKLDKLGHNAEVVMFDDSELHAVTSGRYQTIEEARKVARTLTGKGIDNYVHRRKN